MKGVVKKLQTLLKSEKKAKKTTPKNITVKAATRRVVKRYGDALMRLKDT